MTTQFDSTQNNQTGEQEGESTALKEMFNEARFQQFATELTSLYPAFNRQRFYELALPGLGQLSLMQRLRRMTESIHALLPENYRQTIGILRDLAPRINHSFATLVLPDYVSLYGLNDFDYSMDALKYFTTFGSSEFAVREFLRRDQARALAMMERWSLDDNEHIRRLSSEGSRPRLPWSFRLDALIRDPSPAAPILENLKADPSLYVRKSVANHLNDITKDHPHWVMDRLEAWTMENTHTAWIAKRALRTLIKKGDPRALSLIGAGEKAQVQLHNFAIQPHTIHLGDSITLTFQLQSTAPVDQRLVVDYVVHYVKKSGGTSAKVFKLKEFTLAAGDTITITRSQSIRNFTTRVHYAGRHEVELMVNGEKLGQGYFDLQLA